MHCPWFTHLVYFGQRACALPVSIIVSPHWTPVPQGTFLLQSIIQNVILLTSPPFKSIEVHGRLHGRVVFKAPLCSAAAALQWICGPPLPSSQKKNVSKRKSTSSDGCGGPASALQSLTHWISCSPLLSHLFPVSWEGLFCSFEKQRKTGIPAFFFFFNAPLQKSPLSFFDGLAIRFMVCQKSAMHEKPPPLASASTCFQLFSVTVSQWAELWSEPESCALPSRETSLMRTDKRQTYRSLRPVSLSPNRHHGSLDRRHQTWFGSKGMSHTHSVERQWGKAMADGSNKTEVQCTDTTPTPSKAVYTAGKE